MSLVPHSEHQDNLEPPPSFQRASPRVCGGEAARRRRTAGSKYGRVSSGDVREPESAITSTQVSRATATAPTGFSAEMRACKKDSRHVPSSIDMTSSIGKPGPNPATSQPGHASSAATTTATKMGSSAALASAVRSSFFDPWNSSSTGHQRAENRVGGSTSWRESRNAKLGEQFRGGLSGGARRVADTVGEGSETFGKDGRKANGGWEKGAKGLRTGGQRSLADIWGASKGVKGEGEAKMPFARREEPHSPHSEDVLMWESMDREPSATQTLTPITDTDLFPSTFSKPPTLQAQPKKQIFVGLCFYINGSTAPLVSDLRLKQLLAERGGKTSIGLGRRSVTHVILGTANGHGGAGGGLAATKIQKEIARVGGKGVHFVGVEWILTSIRLDARQPESRFASLKLAAKGQNSVYDMLRPFTSITKDHDEGGRASNG